jgi:hypothetical protein
MLSVEPCLKTTGPLVIEAAEVALEEEDGSRRFAYNESPPLRGAFGADELDIMVMEWNFELQRCQGSS